MRYNVAYECNGRTIVYCVEWSDYGTAQRMLALFIEKYGNGADDVRSFPNGKGTYQVSNPRIVSRS